MTNQKPGLPSTSRLVNLSGGEIKQRKKRAQSGLEKNIGKMEKKKKEKEKKMEENGRIIGEVHGAPSARLYAKA